MGEEKIEIQDLARKVDELVNVLKVISGDLTEISKSLKTVSETASATSTDSTSSSETKQNINEVRHAFSQELSSMLFFEESGQFIIVKPRKFLGSDNFAKIASIVRELGGEYISAGKESHFKIAKKIF